MCQLLHVGILQMLILFWNKYIYCKNDVFEICFRRSAKAKWPSKPGDHIMFLTTSGIYITFYYNTLMFELRPLFRFLCLIDSLYKICKRFVPGVQYLRYISNILYSSNAFNTFGGWEPPCVRLRRSIFCVSLSNHVNLSIICKEKQEQPTAATDVKMTIVTAGGRAINVQVSAYHPSKAKEGEKKRKKKKRKKKGELKWKATLVWSS